MNRSSKLFKDRAYRNMGDIMKVIRLFPKMFTKEESTNIRAPVSLEEIKSILLGFQKTKIRSSMGGQWIFMFKSFRFGGA